MVRKFIAAAAILLIFVPTGSLWAQEANTTSDNVQTYPRSYFDQFNPQTALDIIDRLPGFTLDAGEDVRGFGGSAGNVLIDGSRPSSKTGGIEDALKRIPANSIDRVEVVRGSAGSSEAAGQSVVANIIRAAKHRSGSWEALLQRPSDGRFNINGEVSLTQPLGGWETSVKINAALDRRPLAGTRLSRDADGLLTFSEWEDSPSEVSEIAISADAERPFADGILTLSGQFRRRPSEGNTNRLGFDNRAPDEFPDARRTIDVTRRSLDGELGASWSRPLGNDWTMKLISLSSVKVRDRKQLVSSERPFSAQVSSSTFNSLQDSFETVFRATAQQGGERRLKPEFGSEITYNRLDSNLSLRTADVTGILDISLPAANVLVEELRGEAFVNLLWKVSNKLAFETGISTELSEITVSGDAENTQSFFFAKPFATLIYDLHPSVQLRLGARHSVGQLDFTDFAASASAADDRLTAGNPDLGPDQTTALSMSIDLRSDTRGAINLELFQEWRSDILEQIILPSGSQGVGNAGSARFWGLRVNASLPLSPIIPGGLLELESELLDSTFFDPITNTTRVVSNTDSPSLLVSFRQDLTERRVAWGASYRAVFDGIFFFADEESYNRDGEHWSVFIETTRFLGLKTNLEFSGIGKQNFFRGRRFFVPDRSGVFVGSQDISRDRGMFVSLTMSGQF